MSGGLFTNMLLREPGVALEPERIERLQRLHAEAYKARIDEIQPLPGAASLLRFLTHADIPWAVATSGRMEIAGIALAKLGAEFTDAPIVTRDDVRFAKPDPDLFLAAAARLGIEIGSAFVVGDSVWDMLAAQRARALGIGLLSCLRGSAGPAAPYRRAGRAQVDDYCAVADGDGSAQMMTPGSISHLPAAR